MARPTPARTREASPPARPARPARVPGDRRRGRDTPPPSRRPRSRRRESSGPLPPRLVELLPRAGVRDVALLEPAAARLPDAELDVGLRGDLMRVGVDDELQPRVLRRARMDVAQVETVGLPVDLEEAPDLERL